MEVLIALAIIAIALTAMLKVTSQSINYTNRLKVKNVSHWVALQGLTLIKLGLQPIAQNQQIHKKTKLFGKTIYWKARLISSAIPHVLQIQITTSENQTGPFHLEVTGYQLNENNQSLYSG